VLAFRFALVASLSAIALWGLFSLLDNLKEPELLRSSRAVVVKGCDPIATDQARKVCPGLKCQKAVLDAKLVPLREKLHIEIERTSGPERLIIGVASSSSGAHQSFACLLEHDNVTAARLVSPEDIELLLAEDSDWDLQPMQ
jgi:hypothetical protein